MIWDQQRWQVDVGRAVERLWPRLVGDLIRSAHALRTRAAALESTLETSGGEATELQRSQLEDWTDRANALLSWSVRCQSRGRLVAGIDTAAPYLSFDHQRLNRDPWLLNVENGTLDLRTGQLRPHAREDLLTQLAPVAYDHEARAPQWEAFVSAIMNGRPALVEYLQRVLGYALTGEVREHALFFLHGSGANGKSTLIKVLHNLLGPDYADEAPPDLLLAKADSHPTERADLFGKRFVSTNEAEDGRRLAEALVKQLTGSDAIKGRRMREDFWSFAPTHKLFLAANHRPEIRGTDPGIWRRIHVIPFEVSFLGREDKELTSKLQSERVGILSWLVRGALAWQRQGLAPPPEVSAAVEDYRTESDLLGDFIEECCVMGEALLHVGAGALYESYREWHRRTKSGDPLSSTSFGAKMSQRFTKKKNNGLWYVGIALRS